MIWGVALGLSAALGFGASAVFARLGMQYMRATTGTLVSLVVGVVVTTALAFVFSWDEIFALSGIAFVWFVVVGLINFPVGRLLNYIGVNLAGVSKASTVIATNPLFATALAVTVGGESVNLLIMLGTFAVIGGLALIMSQR